jgi:hypothetical protein
MRNKNPSRTEIKLRAIAAGIEKALPPGKLFFFQQGTIDGSALLARVNAALKPYDDVLQDEADFHRDVALRNAGEDAAQKLLGDAEDGARVSLGETSDAFRDMGFEPRKKAAPLTTEQLAARTEKARLTRAARHTLGPKARKAIRGTLPPPPPPPTSEPGPA